MWYETREFNNPEWTGYIVKEKVRCGKKNCRCFREGKKHEAFYLYYREYQLDGTRKLRKKYLRKSQVAGWQEKLSKHKGMLITGCLTEKQLEKLISAYPNLQGEELCAKGYELFGGSKYASKWSEL